LRSERVIVGAHGNSLRALVMHLDGLSHAEVLELEIPTGAPLLYQFGTEGRITGKRYL
jgi:2,3-bisphosphoglycerate-dependent phosphoglycerate mutase